MLNDSCIDLSIGKLWCGSRGKETEKMTKSYSIKSVTSLDNTYDASRKAKAAIAIIKEEEESVSRCVVPVMLNGPLKIIDGFSEMDVACHTICI